MIECFRFEVEWVVLHTLILIKVILYNSLMVHDGRGGGNNADSSVAWEGFLFVLYVNDQTSNAL